MGRSFRFLLNFAWVNLSAIFGFAAIVIAGCYITGVPNSAENGNLFETYYAMFPTMILMILFLLAFSLCTNNLNLALSMGARRADFFWALQGIMVFYAAVCLALYWFMSILPAAANWAVRDTWALLGVYSGKLWLYPILCIVLMVLGCLSGLVMVRNKILGAVLVTVSIFVMIGVTVFMLLSADSSLTDFLFHSIWNDLPKILLGVLVIVFVGGELLIWRVIHRCIVR